MNSMYTLKRDKIIAAATELLEIIKNEIHKCENFKAGNSVIRRKIIAKIVRLYRIKINLQRIIDGDNEIWELIEKEFEVIKKQNRGHIRRGKMEFTLIKVPIDYYIINVRRGNCTRLWASKGYRITADGNVYPCRYASTVRGLQLDKIPLKPLTITA